MGLPLEIVPTSALHRPDTAALPVHILFEGQPLAGALVKLTNLEHDAEPVETHLTDQYGRTSFAMPTRHLAGERDLEQTLSSTRETDFETFFSSLSFAR